jgi:hypothetical protein
MTVRGPGRSRDCPGRVAVPVVRFANEPKKQTHKRRNSGKTGTAIVDGTSYTSTTAQDAQDGSSGVSMANQAHSPYVLRLWPLIPLLRLHIPACKRACG